MSFYGAAVVLTLISLATSRRHSATVDHDSIEHPTIGYIIAIMALLWFTVYRYKDAFGVLTACKLGFVFLPRDAL